MEPVFTLSYTEYRIANYLNERFKRKNGYSVYVPLSRQEKGIDLILVKREGTYCSSVSIQVKASRTYPQEPPRGENVQRYTYYTWFNRFKVPKEADFFALVSIYPPEENRTKKNTKHSWWSSIVLLFNNHEMKDFMKNRVRTRRGNDDRMFGFGFDTPTSILQTRGIQDGTLKDMSRFLIENRIGMLSDLLNERLKRLKPEQGAALTAKRRR